MKIKVVFILILTFGTSCESKIEKAIVHPMVDGRNTEYAALNVTPIKLADAVNLYLYQNSAYVWISYDYPEGSFGTLDMAISTKKIKKTLNLHISAQLGEWPVGVDSLRPTTANSDLWWNHKGWIANNLWVNGIDTLSYDAPEFKIKNGEIREIQLSKARFGSGEWKIKLNINAIKTREGQFTSIKFPADQEYYTLTVN